MFTFVIWCIGLSFIVTIACVLLRILAALRRWFRSFLHRNFLPITYPPLNIPKGVIVYVLTSLGILLALWAAIGTQSPVR
jgi:hypothetical protein